MKLTPKYRATRLKYVNGKAKDISNNQNALRNAALIVTKRKSTPFAAD
jgi:hypothetical protein